MTYLAVGSEVHDPLIDDRHLYYTNVVHHGCVSAVRRLAEPMMLVRPCAELTLTTAPRLFPASRPNQPLVHGLAANGGWNIRVFSAR